MDTYENDRENILKEIENKVLNKNGHLNGNVIRNKNFKTSELFLKIKNITSFLKDECIFQERYYCIKNRIRDVFKCKCGKIQKYAGGLYSSRCMKCAGKDKKGKSFNVGTLSNRIKLEVAEFKNKLNDNSIEYSDKQEIIEFFNYRITGKSTGFIYCSDYKNNVKILKGVILLTPHIELNDANFNWSNRFYDIINNITSHNICYVCGINKTRFDGIKNGYKKICSSVKCVSMIGSMTSVNKHFVEIEKSLKLQGYSIINLQNRKLKSNIFELECSKCKSILKKDLTGAKWKRVYCPICHRYSNKSLEEKEVFKYIQSLSTTQVLENHKVFLNSKKEVDILVCDKKLAIEYNGDKWHSFGTTMPNNIKEESIKKYSMLNKTLECNNLNIDLLHINSTEWKNVKDNKIWKSIINNKMHKSDRIYARNCKIVEIDHIFSSEFLNKSHLKGSDLASIRLGLEFNGELVYVMTFCKARFTKKYEWEVSRLCNKLNHIVIGGASKIMNYFIRKYNPKSIISYSDARYSTGKVFDKMGFIKMKNTNLSYVYIKNGFVVSRYSKKKKHSDMIIEGYRRLWDCGNIVHVWINTNYNGYQPNN